jgi:tRNA-specific 2-thiouridylase
MMVSGLNLQKYDIIPDGMEALTKIRYKDKGCLSSLYSEGDQMRVHFHDSVKSIAPASPQFFMKGMM